jgi:metal-sulfur cluster biosynthetic enzyme
LDNLLVRKKREPQLRDHRNYKDIINLCTRQGFGLIMMDIEAVLSVLRRVLDPEHPISVVEMGLVKSEDISINENQLHVQFAPTVPGCPMGAVIGIIIRKALEDAFPGQQVQVQVKPGTHLREDACNNMINDNAQYQSAVEKLTASGALDRLIVKQ